ncbi:hypothetical protein STEG23_019022, partial [Scotinomys teguina]
MLVYGDAGSTAQLTGYSGYKKDIAPPDFKVASEDLNSVPYTYARASAVGNRNHKFCHEKLIHEEKAQLTDATFPVSFCWI